VFAHTSWLQFILIMSFVLSAIILALTSNGVKVESSARRRVAAPQTWGLAIEVPEIVLSALSDVCQADLTKVPGAKTSILGPQLENVDLKSACISSTPVNMVEPTQATVGALAGE